jgi:hypothetical protein
MSFYITLPSHAADTVSEYGKRTNTQNNFSINLKNPIRLNSNRYVVALAEISFTNFWKIDLGRFTLTNESNEIVFDEQIFMYDGLSINEVCKFLTDKFSDVDKSKGVLIADADYMILSKNDEFFKNFVGLNLNVVSFTCISEWLPYIVGIHVPLGYTLSVKGYFSQMLHERMDTSDSNGLLFGRKLSAKEEDSSNSQSIKQVEHTESENLIIRGKKNSIIKFYCNNTNLKVINNLFVYSNIISDVAIGEDTAKLLRIVQVNKNFDNLNCVIYENPHYVPLESNYIDRINMVCRDQTGSEVKFLDTHTPIIYKLHFKKE